MADLSLRLCSFNCRSLKSSLYEIRQLCADHDLICVQEHWLLPFELNMLSDIHEDFNGFGLSAVDISSNVLIVGQLYGGTAVLYRKHLAHSISVVNNDKSRITAVLVLSDKDPILCANVYMPTYYGDSDSLENYIDICSKLCVLFTKTEAVYMVIADDFNCEYSARSRFFATFIQFITTNKLAYSDKERLTCRSSTY